MSYGSAELRRLARWRHSADLDENVESVKLIPMLDEASVFDPPDLDRAHGDGVARSGIAEIVTAPDLGKEVAEFDQDRSMLKSLSFSLLG